MGVTLSEEARLGAFSEPFQPRKPILAGFNPDVRSQIDELARSCRRHADLATTFPGLLFALATGYATAAKRAQARRMIRKGQPLKQVAAALGLPYWLRHLPAQAFDRPLLRLPAAEQHVRRLVPVIPCDPARSRAWLHAIQIAATFCDDAFACWLAERFYRSRGELPRNTAPSQVYLMSAWAWYSQHSDDETAHFIDKPWLPSMGLKRALDEAASWRKRVELARATGSRHLVSPWIRSGTCGDFDFILLRTPRDFITEAALMDNCLDQFADQMTTRESLVFSVRRSGRPIATMEVGRHPEEPTMPAILQLRGPRNRRSAARTWKAAYLWLGRQKMSSNPRTAPRGANQTVRRNLEKAFWQPYLKELRARKLKAADVRQACEQLDCPLQVRRRREPVRSRTTRKPGSEASGDGKEL